MFSISQLVETITENIDPNTTFIRIVYNDRHALRFKNKTYTTCFIRPILITTKNHEEIDLTNIQFIKWTYDPKKPLRYTNFSEEWFIMSIETKKHTYKGTSYYKHNEYPLEDECRTQRDREVIKEHVNDKEIKYKEIKDVSQ